MYFRSILGSLLLLLLSSSHSSWASFIMPSPYGWHCVSGRCVREERQPLSTLTLGPLSTCKLTCGPHGVLWPLPTKYTRLSKQTQHFQLSSLLLSNVRAPDAEVEQLTRDAWVVFLDNVGKMAPPDQQDGGDTSTTTTEEPTTTLIPEASSTHQVKVDITVSVPGTILLFRTPELYTLSVTSKPLETTGNQTVASNEGSVTLVTIIGRTFFGARHALETLSQLMEFNDQEDAFEIVSTAAVVDEPVYPYRGILLDTARNFFTVDSIKRTLDAMAANKLNTLHWHLSDSQSFPVQLRSLPKVSYYGAFSARQVYTRKDILDIVKYARVRGVRVLPEVDAPGHVGNGLQWGEAEGLGELLACFNKRPWTQYCVEPPCGQFNLANPNIYMVLEKIYREYLELFGPLEIFHFGGDEINLECWKSTQEITDMMTETGAGLSDAAYYAEWAKFQKKATQKLVEANGGVNNITGILWTSKLTEKHHVQEHLNKSQYIIQVWSNKDDVVIKDLLEAGYRLILSNADAWYLDCGFSAWVGSGLNWCSPYKNWQKVYEHRPSEIARAATGGDSYARQILGGEVAAWSEQMDSVSLDFKVWPRAAAFAERVWSDPSGGWALAEGRLVHQRQRLVSRGVGADRLQPEWCHQNDEMCTLYG